MLRQIAYKAINKYPIKHDTFINNVQNITYKIHNC